MVSAVCHIVAKIRFFLNIKFLFHEVSASCVFLHNSTPVCGSKRVFCLKMIRHLDAQNIFVLVFLRLRRRGLSLRSRSLAFLIANKLNRTYRSQLKAAFEFRSEANIQVQKCMKCCNTYIHARNHLRLIRVCGEDGNSRRTIIR